MWTLVFTFLVYWLVAFVGCFTAVEIAQDALYDEVTPRAGLKVTLASVILALVMTYYHPSFETMFTANLLSTVLQGIVWFGVFTLVLQFHPWHALGLGLLLMCLVSPLATMGVDSMLAPDDQVRRIRAGTSAATKPVRGSLSPTGSAPGSAAVAEPEAAAEPTEPAAKTP
ncbi:hypothetical protein [Planctomyces sp. SH-PL62]|uniref:hypothetical protein n=1 Tax=Planctomyces sp. SH-PL62 TaxID=1636152 RepID=UPI00078C9CEB|nr:hypothetical protein [Planctomyces sp. SH-PL62]AMV39842.1 hypothetical protein VT85_20590 [Planctomyces sp. SH-PL62]